MKTTVILPCLMLVCSLLSGCCFGFIAVHPKTETLEHFSLPGGMCSVRPEATQENPTAAKVLELWGRPDSKRSETNGVVVWHYKGCMWTFAGIVPMFVAPAPLVVPTGIEYVDIYTKDGMAVKAVKHITDGVGGGLGPDLSAGFQNARGNLGDSFSIRSKIPATSPP